MSGRRRGSPPSRTRCGRSPRGAARRNDGRRVIFVMPGRGLPQTPALTTVPARPCHRTYRGLAPEYRGRARSIPISARRHPQDCRDVMLTTSGRTGRSSRQWFAQQKGMLAGVGRADRLLLTTASRRSRMTLQYVYGATVVVFAFGVVTVGPAYAQRRDGSLLPQERERGGDRGGMSGSWHCGARRKEGQVRVGAPEKGPVASVPEASCTADPGADALMVDNPEKGNITDATLGRWVEISGRLERETSKDPDNLRELDVASFRLVPVVIPPRTGPGTARRRGTATGPTGTGADACTCASASPRASSTLPKTASPFQRLDWPGCSRLQQASCFVRSVSGDEVDGGPRVEARGSALTGPTVPRAWQRSRSARPRVNSS